MNDFWNKILPGSVKTDHGKFNAADLLIVVLNIFLFGYTAYRSWRFLQGTFAGNDPNGEFTIAAIIALVGLDIAAVAWSLVWMFGSTSKWQDIVALCMFIISLIGMVLTSMVDTLSGEGVVPESLQTIAYYGVPAIILLNVAAGIAYHMISPQVSLSRKERRMKAENYETRRLGELAQKNTATKLEIAENQSRQNDALIARQQQLAQQKIVLDGINLGISQAMSDDTLVKNKGDEVSGQIRSNVAKPSQSFAQDAPTLPRQPSGAYVPPETAQAIDRYKFDENARHQADRVHQQIGEVRNNAAAQHIDLNDIVYNSTRDGEGDAARLAAAQDLLRRLQDAYQQRYKAQIVGHVPKA